MFNVTALSHISPAFVKVAAREASQETDEKPDIHPVLGCLVNSLYSNP